MGLCAQHCGPAPVGAAARRVRECAGVVLAAWALAVAAPALAVNYVWNNAAGGNWSTATNWTPNGVPNATSDTATIALAGTYTVTVDASVTVNTLTIGGASGTQTLAIAGGIVNLNAGGPVATMTVNANGAVNQSAAGVLQGGPAQVAMNGRYDMASGSINSGVNPFTIGPGATFALAGGAVKTLQSSSTIVNNGTITSSGSGSLQVENNATLNNAAGGVIELQSDAGLLQSGGGASNVTNAGILRKTAGAGTSTLSTVQIVNTGTIEAQAGTLQLGTGQSTVTSSGAGNTLGALGGATLTIGAVGGTFTGTTFAGAGLKSFAGGGTAQFTFGGAISATNTTFADSTLLGTFTLAGTLGWASGTLQGSPTIGPGGTLALSGNLVKTLTGVGNTLTNNGTLAIAGTGTLRVENSAALVNAATGTIDLQSDVAIAQTGGGTSTLTNAGLLRKSGGAGTSTVTPLIVNNTGTIDAQSGTLSFAQPFGFGALQSTGAGNAFNAQPGATLTIAMGSSSTFAGTTFGGLGTKSIGTAGNASVPHTYSGTVAATNTTILGGLHRGTFALNGELAMSGGVMAQGASFHMTIPAGATFTFTGGGAKQLLGGAGVTARITNNGTLRFASTSPLQGDNGAFIQNAAGGQIEFLAQGGLGTTGAASPSVLQNQGTVRFASGTTVPVTSWQVTNTGTISVQSGVFAWSGANASFGQTAGRLELAGGGMSNQQHLSISGGVLAGTGAIAGPGAVNLSGAAQTRPGTSPGQITVGGPYVQLGALHVELNGVTAGTQYDQVVGQGTVSLGGQLVVTRGFVPPVGTVFRIVDKTSAGAAVGAFTGLPEGTVLTVQGVQLQISYAGGDGNDVTLTVVTNTGLVCTPFTDVDAASAFCPNVQWMKERGVTVGCTSTLYCPSQPTTRAQMALFMNRLGNVLQDAVTKVETTFSGNPDAGDVVCQTADLPAADYARAVKGDAVAMVPGGGGGAAQVGWAIVASVDGGANWVPLAPAVPAQLQDGLWANVRLSGDRDVAPTEVVRYGVQLTRISGGGQTGVGRCVLRLATGNRVPAPAADGVGDR